MARTNKMRIPITRYAIVGDGFTEKIYFDQLKEHEQKEHEQINNLSIEPKLPDKGGFKTVIRKCTELIVEGYDRVYGLIDYDKIVEDGKVNDYKMLKEKKLKEYNNLIILENNPCFEFWYLLHYHQTSKSFSFCEAVEKILRKQRELKDYSKNQEYLMKKDIYKTLKQYQKKTAIPNAKLLEEDRLNKDARFPRAEVYKLIEELVE